MSGTVRWSQVHQKGQQQAPTHLNSSSSLASQFNDPFHGSIPRTYSQALPSEGSEFYTLQYGANHLQQYPQGNGPHVQNTSTLPAPAPSPNPHGRSERYAIRNPSNHQHSQHNRANTASKPRSHGSTSASHNTLAQDRRRNPSKVDNYGVENSSTKTPQRSTQGTPSNSRRGSAISLSGGANHGGHHVGLRCHYKDCRNIFGNDDEWRIHKIYSCRSRYFSPNGFQCSFVACPLHGETIDQVPPEASTPHPTCDSLADLLKHEKVHHEVLVCVDCHYTFLGGETTNIDEHRQVCPSRVPGRHNHTNSSTATLSTNTHSEGQQKKKFVRRWVPDLQHVLSNRIASEKSYFVNLDYPERFADGNGEDVAAIESSNSETIKFTNSFMEPLRTAMAKQLIGTLRLHNDFLTSASEVTLELTPREKNEVREYLASMARLLRIDLDTESSSTLETGRSHYLAPTITVSSATSAAPGIETSTGEEMNPSENQTCTRSPLKPSVILSRSSSPSRQPNPAAAIPVAEFHSPAEISEEPKAPKLDPPKSTINLVGTNSAVITKEHGEPLQEINISGDEQYTYFAQMMNCCLQAVYEWFERNREVLLENCECSILGVLPAGGQVHGPQPSEGNGNTPLSKSQKKKAKKAASAAILGLSMPSTPNNTPGDDTQPKVCLLHTVTGPDTLNLPRWTHYLRRLVEQGRIPASIISNKDSFSGEIQPVDEVRHAYNKQKLKSDRDLLALVQQARKFCWQLKDWERCRHLDELYGILEDKIKLVKEEESRDWETAGGKKGSLRGRRGGQGKVGFGSGNDVKTTKEGTGGEGGSRGRRPNLHVRPSLTWPLRMLGSEELVD